MVIGGSHFIGLQLLEQLVNNGHRITVFNRGKILSKYPNGVRHIKGDRNDGFGVNDYFDSVIDMCACNGIQTKLALAELNFNFFIHMSTATVYKKTDIFPLTEKSPLGDWPLWGDYNRGKGECEKALEESKIAYASLRPVYVLGPKNYLDRERFLYSSLKNGLPIILPGNGRALVQFVSVRDVAGALVLLAENKLPGVFNCAGDEIFTLKGFVEELGRVSGFKPRLRYNELTDGIRFNPQEFPFANEHLVCANNKIKNSGLSFTPLTSALKQDYENYYRALC